MFARQTQYIMKLLLELAHTSPGSYCTVSDLAEDTEMPRPYLSKLAGVLSTLGYLETQKGPGGGIKLSRPPTEISLQELFEDLGELEHDPGEDLCCEASPFSTCYIGQLISTMRENVIGEDTLQTALEQVRSSPRVNGAATTS